jgi:hypothetical protein
MNEMFVRTCITSKDVTRFVSKRSENMDHSKLYMAFGKPPSFSSNRFMSMNS